MLYDGMKVNAVVESVTACYGSLCPHNASEEIQALIPLQQMAGEPGSPFLLWNNMKGGSSSVIVVLYFPVVIH